MRRLLWLLVAALLTAGCSTASGRQAGDMRPLPRPLGGAFHLTAAENAALHRAEERRVRACMRQRGFTYRTAPAHDRPFAANPCGLLTEDQAQVDGYGVTGRKLDGLPPAPNAEHLESLSRPRRTACEEALKGEPGGGRERVVLPDGSTISFDPDSCVHVAQQRLYGEDWTRRFSTLPSLRSRAVRDTLGRPAVREARRAWSACMKEAGFGHAGPHDARAAARALVRSAASDAALGAAGEREMRTARRDAACQVEVRLAERVTAAQDDVEAALSPDRTAGLGAFRAERWHAVPGATPAGGLPEKG